MYEMCRYFLQVEVTSTKQPHHNIVLSLQCCIIEDIYPIYYINSAEMPLHWIQSFTSWTIGSIFTSCLHLFVEEK